MCRHELNWYTSKSLKNPVFAKRLIAVMFGLFFRQVHVHRPPTCSSESAIKLKVCLCSVVIYIDNRFISL